MNIPGVTILYTSKYSISETWGWSWGGFIFAAIALLGLIGLIVGCNDKEDENSLVLIVMGIFALAMGVTLSLFIFAHGTAIYGTEYNVTIDNDVTFSQVANQYEVSSMNGRLYTLRPHTVVPWTED